MRWMSAMRGLGAALLVVASAGCAGNVCGNGIVEPTEKCDDGNTENWDQCSATCDDALSHLPGLESAYDFLNDGSVYGANLLLEDKWPVTRYEPVHLPPPPTWREDPFKEKFWQFEFYGLRPTRHLLYAYRMKGDRRYRDKLVEIIASFAERGQTSTFSHDVHATAYRTHVLVNTYWKLRMARALAPEEEKRFLDLIESSARFLEKEEHFDGNNNHGFAEAAALLLVAENFPDWPESKRWASLARNRFQKLFIHAVDVDGAPNENAPYYHFYMLTQLWQVQAWIRRFELEEIPGMDTTIRKMIQYATYIVLPDGQVPMLGGSLLRDMHAYEPGLYRKMGEKDPRLAYVLSAGEDGTEPPLRLALFPTSGTAIFRSGFGQGEDFRRQTHLIFDMGPYRTAHSHLDALSIHLYAAGRTVLVDSGHFTNDPGPDFDYFHGTKAHNTVVVDEKDQQKGSGRVGLTETKHGWMYQSGWHDTLYPGVKHARGVLFLAPEIVLVLDRLESDRAHTYDQTWHFPPDATLHLEGPKATAFDASGTALVSIRQLPSDPGQPIRRRGATNPVDGWYSERYLVKVPSDALRYRKIAARAHYATLITVGRSAAAPASLSAGDGQEAPLVACVAGTAYQVYVHGLGEPDEALAVDPMGPCSP